MSGEHDLPEDFILKWMEKYENKVLVLEELKADELANERKRSAAVFSDAQDERIEAKIARAILALLGSEPFSRAVTKEVKFIAGSEALRFWVCVVGAFLVGAVSVLIRDWFKH